MSNHQLKNSILSKRIWLIRALHSHFPKCCRDVIANEADEAIALYIVSPARIQSCPHKTASWLLITARRNMVRRLRESQKFIPLPDDSCAPTHAPGGTWSEEVRHDLITDSEVDDIREYLYCLSAGERELIELLLENYSLREIAVRLSISAEAAYKRYQRAIGKVQEHHGIAPDRKKK